MRIDATQTNTYSLQGMRRATNTAPSANADTPSIGDQVMSALDKVDNLQKTADSMAEKVASGNIEDTHKAMISMEHALMALDFTLQVRNKMLDAYQEIMRTQV